MDDLNWETVTSSNVDAIAYESPTNTLFVRFKSGAIYMYQEVPRFVYQTLRSAGSKGKFHYSAIRTTYNYARIR